ncbi:MAG: GtrA family protein [Gloeotrichia echinulata DVL01]
MCKELEKNEIRENPYLDINYPRLQLGLSWLSIARFMRFGVVGLSGVAVDLGVFYFLHKPLNLTLTLSAMFSTEVAIINNFLWNDVWTFGDVYQEQQSISKRLQRFLKFNLICCFGLILNSLIVNWLFYKFGVNEYIAKLGVIAGVTLWNFWLNLKLNWQVRKSDIVIINN